MATHPPVSLLLTCSSGAASPTTQSRLSSSTWGFSSLPLSARNLSFVPYAAVGVKLPALRLSRTTPLGFTFASSSCTFLEGETGKLSQYFMLNTKSRKKQTGSPRASADDVPPYKGYPAMTKKPRWWWRVLACIPYMMPLTETWMYAETVYSYHAFFEDFEFITYPFLVFIGSLPSWFLLAYFFGAYLGVVRNNRWPHFFRFHVVTGMLLEIVVQVAGTINDWVPQSFYWGKLGALYWLAISLAFLFTALECLKCALNGMYADVPFLSDASYMQIPYDT
eukprot:c47605_g1_i1 orf=161-997(-)